MTEIKPEWLVEIAPHYYKLKDVEEGKRHFTCFALAFTKVCFYPIGMARKMPLGKGKASEQGRGTATV